jgi:hypothetical protein
MWQYNFNPMWQFAIGDDVAGVGHALLKNGLLTLLPGASPRAFVSKSGTEANSVSIVMGGDNNDPVLQVANDPSPTGKLTGACIKVTDGGIKNTTTIINDSAVSLIYYIANHTTGATLEVTGSKGCQTVGAIWIWNPNVTFKVTDTAGRECRVFNVKDINEALVNFPGAP